MNEKIAALQYGDGAEEMIAMRKPNTISSANREKQHVRNSQGVKRLL